MDDQTGSPTWARALAKATAELLRRKDRVLGNSGVYHLAASGYASRYEFANEIIRIMQDVSGEPGGWAKVRPITTGEYPLPARRPRNPVISKDKIGRVFGIVMPHWRDQVRTLLRELAVSRNWER